MTSINGRFFKSIGNFWRNLRIFHYHNRSIFEILFISLYAIEQLMLVITLTYFPKYNLITVSMFAIIFTTTFALHKTALESKMRVLESELLKIKLKESEYKKIVKQQFEEIKSDTKNLYNIRSINNLKRG